MHTRTALKQPHISKALFCDVRLKVCNCILKAIYLAKRRSQYNLFKLCKLATYTEFSKLISNENVVIHYVKDVNSHESDI